LLLGKPAKFRRVMPRAGMSPAQVIAIGDEVRDIEGAARGGHRLRRCVLELCSAPALGARRPDVVFDRTGDIPSTFFQQPNPRPMVCQT
jgi:phosphoglycolate phosphatase